MIPSTIPSLFISTASLHSFANLGIMLCSLRPRSRPRTARRVALQVQPNSDIQSPRPLCLVLLISKDSNTNKISQKVRIQNLIGCHTSGKVTKGPGRVLYETPCEVAMQDGWPRVHLSLTLPPRRRFPKIGCRVAQQQNDLFTSLCLPQALLHYSFIHYFNDSFCIFCILLYPSAYHLALCLLVTKPSLDGLLLHKAAAHLILYSRVF
jgi:hypothetical protein